VSFVRTLSHSQPPPPPQALVPYLRRHSKETIDYFLDRLSSTDPSRDAREQSTRAFRMLLSLVRHGPAVEVKGRRVVVPGKGVYRLSVYTGGVNLYRGRGYTGEGMVYTGGGGRRGEPSAPRRATTRGRAGAEAIPRIRPCSIDTRPPPPTPPIQVRDELAGRWELLLSRTLAAATGAPDRSVGAQLRFQGIQLIRAIAKHKPEWLPSHPEVLGALIGVWSSAERKERLSAEKQAAMPLEQVTRGGRGYRQGGEVITRRGRRLRNKRR
jgi:hypothetical protein